MMVLKKNLPRRMVLRGLGASLALPLLDAMVPAFTATAKSAAAPVRRFAYVYVPHGTVMDKWTPATEGAGFEFTPILQPLAPFRERLTVVSGLALKPANPQPGDGVGDHARAASAALTGVRAKKTEGADIRAGLSVDQLIAKEIGRDTQLQSLEMSLEPTEFVGACDSGYSCVYVNTLCWRNDTTPLPMENNPRAVFERLFGGSGSTEPAARRAAAREDRSILDDVMGSAAQLQSKLGVGDRGKLTQYLDAVRDVERRVQIAEEQSNRELPPLEQPMGVPRSFDEYAKLMFDLQVLAYQVDITRVITFMVAKEVSSRAFPEIGVPDAYHTLSHHGNRVESLQKLATIGAYQTQLLAYYLEKLQSTPDGEGSLLDHMLIVYASGMSNGNTHLHHNLPVLLLGGGRNVRGGRHVRVNDAPLANLYLTAMDKLGVALDTFGDSNGTIDLG